MLFVIVAIPIVSVVMPPLYDYPNHLARMDVLAHWDSSAWLQRYYTIHWSVLPNLGAEFLLLPLMKVTSLFNAGKVGILLIIAIQMAATCLLHYALVRRFSVLPLVAFLFVYNEVLQFGFLSYLLGVGLAIASFALWILLRHVGIWKRTALFLAVCALLFVVHLYAVGIFGLCAGAYELGEFVRTRKPMRYRWSHFVPLVACGVLTLCLLALSPTGKEYGAITWPSYGAPWHYLLRLQMLAGAMPSAERAGSDDYHIAFLAVLLLYLGGFLAGALRIVTAAVVPLIAMTAVLLLIPGTIFSSWASDLRFSIVLMFIFVASVRWERETGRAAALVATAIVCAVGARTIHFTSAWTAYDRRYQRLIEAMSLLPTGSRLTAAIAYEGEAETMRYPSLNHLGNLIVPLKQGFYTTFFANAGQQPVHLRAPYDALQRTYDDVSFRNDQLKAPYLERTRDPFAREVLSRYDYILLVGESRFAMAPPTNLTTIYAAPDFRMARIDHPDAR